MNVIIGVIIFVIIIIFLGLMSLERSQRYQEKRLEEIAKQLTELKTKVEDMERKLK
ncbi:MULTISPECIES: hypothetical protein [Bacillaceae]|uniref:Phage shock protein B n=1 Tax=Evansella alkalicola TaxID=745819 RepID=A0ABS6JVI0_9BACI|nr:MULTISPECIES: hypothetical protein [Bacillaceae]MBU9722395.1 hypothetical protein [Bacillus alkalicola]